MLTSDYGSDKPLKYTHCCNCSMVFTDANVYSDAGWKETQISGLCELCWDDIIAYAEEEEAWYGSYDNDDIAF